MILIKKTVNFHSPPFFLLNNCFPLKAGKVLPYFERSVAWVVLVTKMGWVVLDLLEPKDVYSEVSSMVVPF